MPLLDKIAGVGLDSSEVGHPPEKFARVFARCRELGLHLVAHAGEEAARLHLERARCPQGGAHRPWRTGRARCRADAAPGAWHRIALTVCPLSNQKLCVFPDLADHNLGKLLEAGLAATVNSDDPAYFGGYINDNFTQVFAATGLTARHAYQLAFNSFEASFAGNATSERGNTSSRKPSSGVWSTTTERVCLARFVSRGFFGCRACAMCTPRVRGVHRLATHRIDAASFPSLCPILGRRPWKLYNCVNLYARAAV